MANPPIIVRKKPADGDVAVNPTIPISFGIRDVETRASLESVYSAISFAKTIYRPAELPEDDPVLLANETVVAFSIFNDAAGATLPQDPCDQTIETVGIDEVYRIERTTGGAQEGFLYLSDSAYSGPYIAKAKFDLQTLTTGTADYVTFTDFTGVLFGLVYWPMCTGVFLFFRDDGVTKRITVAGPSADGIGTRPTSTTVTFDWSAEVYTYSVLFDKRRDKVLAVVTDSLGVETVIAEFTLSAINTFLPSVVLGNYEATSPPDKVMLVVGTDGPTAGDYLDVYNADLFRFGKSLVMGGGPGASSTVIATPFESLLTANLPSAVADWDKVGTGTLARIGATFAVTRQDGPAEYLNLSREEPDLSRREWMLIVKMEAVSVAHYGSYNTGMGIDIEDGTNRFMVRLLDDFVDRTLGIYSVVGGYIGDTLSYTTPGTFDWTSSFQMVVQGSALLNDMRVFLNGDVSPTLSMGSYAAPDGSSLMNVAFGFMDADQVYYGSMCFSWFWLFPNCQFFEGSEATFPEAQGWLRTAAGGSRSLADDRLSLVDTVPGQYDIYYLQDPDYSDTSGLAILLRLKISSWTSADSSTDSSNVEIGPLVMLSSSSSTGVQLFFTESNDGKQYAFLAHDEYDVVQVLTQTELGREISTEVDFTEEHVYLIIEKPLHYVRLYIDYDPTPAIELPWASKDKVLRPFPTYVPPTAVAAVGSLGENSGVAMQMAFARLSIGTGYDLSVQMNFHESDLAENVYGSVAALLIDFEDVDP